MPKDQAKFEDWAQEQTTKSLFFHQKLHEWGLYQSRGHSLQKQARLKTPSLRFPLLAGGTEPVRGSPREAGGTCRRGAIVNSARAIGITDGRVSC
jgi:hypothetical protein